MTLDPAFGIATAAAAPSAAAATRFGTLAAPAVAAGLALVVAFAWSALRTRTLGLLARAVLTTGEFGHGGRIGQRCARQGQRSRAAG